VQDNEQVRPYPERTRACCSRTCYGAPRHGLEARTVWAPIDDGLQWLVAGKELSATGLSLAIRRIGRGYAVA